MPKLTFGMAHHTDYHGAYFTIQSFRLHQLPALQKAGIEVKLVVIDNSPNTKHSDDLRGLINHIMAAKDGMSVEYVPFENSTGTTQTRQEIFNRADEDSWVLVCDCHVLIPDSKALIDIVSRPPDKNIYSGPMYHDTLHGAETHFNMEWRGEMLGTWGSTWAHHTDLFPTVDTSKFFTVMNADGVARFTNLDAQSTPILENKPIAQIIFNGFQQQLLSKGFKQVGLVDQAIEFDIPGQGLGMFLANKRYFPGFNPHFRGFGGEEMYIHEKVRQAGGRVICHTGLKWLHRFGRPDGPPYPLQRYAKVRNYVLGHMELGWSFQGIEDHFVATNLFPRVQWEHLLKDPIAHDKELIIGSGCNTCGTKKNVTEFTNSEDAFRYVQEKPRDLNEHVINMRRIADSCESVVEFSKRKESTVVWLSSNVKTITSFNTEAGPLMTTPDKEGQVLNLHLGKPSLDVREDEFPETDLLYIDTKHTAMVLDRELRHAKKVKKYIILRGTYTNGEKGEDGGPGLLPSVREFIRLNPEWFVKEHYTHQYGMTVLSRLQEERRPMPSLLTMGLNYAKAMAKSAAALGKKVTEEEYEDRLKTCQVCPMLGKRNGVDACSVCGCPIEAKALLATEVCPIAHWNKN